MNIYTPTIAWETYAKDVENSPTGDHYFYLNVSSINPNDYGVDQKEVGDYFIDYLGFCYKITDLSVEGDSNRIEVYEITEGANYPQGLTKPPYPEMNGFVYRPLNDAIILTQAQLRRLHSSAKDVIQPLEKAALATQDQLLSVGKIYPDPTYIDNGDGTITVEEADIALHDNPNGTGQIKVKMFKETTLTLTDNAVNYVIANWNNANDNFEVTSDVELISESDVAPVFTVVRTGTVLHVLNWDSMGTNLVNKLHQRLVKTERFARQSGLSLEVTPTRVVNIAPGIVWYGARSINLSGVNSTDSFCSLYYHQAGQWTSMSVNQFPNTQYDDGTDLQTMKNNRYSSVFVLRGVEDDDHIYLVLGNNEYVQTSDAEDAEVPPLPDVVQAHAILVGKIVFEKNVDVPISVSSAFERFFSYSSITDHGNLTGLTDDDHPQYAKLDGRSGDILKIDTINEYTTDNGVDIEGVKIKDGFIDWAFISNKPEFTSEYLVKEITQASHGFDNDFVFYNGTQWQKAIADNSDTCATHFAVSTGTDTFDLIPVGELSNISITDELGDPLVPGDYYFLSQTTAGKMTIDQPSTGIVQSVLKANSTNNVTILVEEPFIYQADSSFLKSPLTTKGDIWTYASDDARLPVGINGQVLSADSSEPTGLKWIDAPSGGGSTSPGSPYNSVQFNNAGSFGGDSDLVFETGDTPSILKLTGKFEIYNQLDDLVLSLSGGDGYASLNPNADLLINPPLNSNVVFGNVWDNNTYLTLHISDTSSLTKMLDIGKGTTDLMSLDSDGSFFLPEIIAGTDSNILYYDSSTGEVSYGSAPSGGSGSPGGTDGQMQYNNGGSFGGTNMIFDDSTSTYALGTTASFDTLLNLAWGDYSAQSTLFNWRDDSNTDTILKLDYNNPSQGFITLESGDTSLQTMEFRIISDGLNFDTYGGSIQIGTGTISSTNSEVRILNSSGKLGFFGVNTVVQQGPTTFEDNAIIDATYGSEERDVIINMRQRLKELEIALINYGLLIPPVV